MRSGATTSSSWLPAPELLPTLHVPPYVGLLALEVNSSSLALSAVASMTLPPISLAEGLLDASDLSATAKLDVVTQTDQPSNWAFALELLGTTDIGGADGFTASFAGSFASSAVQEAAGSDVKQASPFDRLTLNVVHSGGWSPVDGVLAAYLTTPSFTGSVNMTENVFLTVNAFAQWLTPIELLPGGEMQLSAEYAQQRLYSHDAGSSPPFPASLYS